MKGGGTRNEWGAVGGREMYEAGVGVRVKKRNSRGRGRRVSRKIMERRYGGNRREKD